MNSELMNIDSATRRRFTDLEYSFGFLDGVSNPSIAGFDPVVPGPAPIDASHMLTGHNADNDWTIDGSFLVFRYLFQKVPEFNAFLNGNALQTDPITSAKLSQGDGSALLGARLVGRWKSGECSDHPRSVVRLSTIMYFRCPC
jgi:deferrochelatase/peroxidase EfeB